MREGKTTVLDLETSNGRERERETGENEKSIREKNRGER